MDEIKEPNLSIKILQSYDASLDEIKNLEFTWKPIEMLHQKQDLPGREIWLKLHFDRPLEVSKDISDDLIILTIYNQTLFQPMSSRRMLKRGTST